METGIVRPERQRKSLFTKLVSAKKKIIIIKFIMHIKPTEFNSSKYMKERLIL